MTETTGNLGEIVIAPEVLEVIIAETASKIDGVYTLRSKRTLETFGKKSQGKGVYIKSDEGSVSVDLYLYVTADSRIQEVAQNIQREVKEKVLVLTEVIVNDVNVHVIGIVSEAVKMPDFDDLFKEGFFDVD